MSPLDRAALYAAKLAAAFIFMAVAEAASIILMVLFFNLEFDARVMRLVPAVLLGALGFAALATLLAGISSRLRGGDLVSAAAGGADVRAGAYRRGQGERGGAGRRAAWRACGVA